MKINDVVEISIDKIVRSHPLCTYYFFRFLCCAIFNKSDEIYFQEFNGVWSIGFGRGDDARILTLPDIADGNNLMKYIHSICHRIESIDNLGSSDGIGQFKISDEIVVVLFYFGKRGAEEWVVMKLLYGKDAPDVAFAIDNALANIA